MPDRPFTYSLRVRYAECDMQGHVFNANYLTYLDLALTELLREAIGSYTEMVAAGADFVVAETTLRYRRGAHYDEELRIAVLPRSLTTSSLTTDFTIHHEDALVLEATIRHVCVDPATMRKRPWLDDFRQALEPYCAPAPA
jgi:acyl-CoA thioester hydrolase